MSGGPRARALWPVASCWEPGHQSPVLEGAWGGAQWRGLRAAPSIETRGISTGHALSAPALGTGAKAALDLCRATCWGHHAWGQGRGRVPGISLQRSRDAKLPSHSPQSQCFRDHATFKGLCLTQTPQGDWTSWRLGPGCPLPSGGAVWSRRFGGWEWVCVESREGGDQCLALHLLSSFLRREEDMPPLPQHGEQSEES